jgi:hypothetical protein
MGTVTRAYSEVDGSIGEASSVNRVIDDLYTELNGSLNSANIDSSGIATINIQDSAITTAKINGSAVTTSAIADNAVTYNKLAFTEIKILMTEVF